MTKFFADANTAIEIRKSQVCAMRSYGDQWVVVERTKFPMSRDAATQWANAYLPYMAFPTRLIVIDSMIGRYAR
jgi:hypothetical protein